MIGIPVFIACDDNYAKYAAVVVSSIVNNTKSKVSFFILSRGLSRENTLYLSESAKGNPLEILKVDAKIFESFDVKMHWKYITIETCFRYLIADLRPDIDKAIYLDCDVIALDDIAKLYSIDLGDALAGVVKEKSGSDYFCAGVMLFNCKRIREENLVNEFMKKSAELNGKLKFFDQDVLNIVLKNRVKFIDPRWQITPFSFGKNSGLSRTCQYQALSNPGIVHLSGNDKPWQTPRGIAANPFSPFFFYYLADTPYKSERSKILSKFKPVSSALKLFYRNPAILFKRQFWLRRAFYKKSVAALKSKQGV